MTKRKSLMRKNLNSLSLVYKRPSPLQKILSFLFILGSQSKEKRQYDTIRITRQSLD